MRAALAAIVALAAPYFADRELAGGKYTQVTLKMVQQMRYSMGI